MTRYYDLPMDADLHAVTAQAGLRLRMDETAPPSRHEATILDTPDARLLGWGIALSHHLSHGVSNWRLQAPEWEPWIPRETTEEATDGEVPMRFADVIRPFRRAGLLGPLADFEVESDHLLGELPDDTLAVRIADREFTAHQGVPAPILYRQLSIEYLADGCEEALARSITRAGGTAHEQVPALVTRLGRRSHIASRTHFDAALPMAAFVVSWTELRWRQLLQAHFAAGPEEAVVAVLARVRADAVGLSGLLEPGWVAAFLDLLDAALQARRPVHTSARYYLVLDELERMTQDPMRIVRPDDRACGSLLRQELERLVHDASDRSRALGVASSDAQWRDASRAAARAAALTTAASELLAAESAPLAKALGRVVEALEQCEAPPDVSRREVAALTAAEAFERGRAYEKALHETAMSRVAYLDRVAPLWKKVKKVQVRP